ncbi:hypothetical protein CB0940_01705 [Cercospora beticola]|uniref:Apple domain-containing protein n=1 Tax=Cercospora beticola TaxID=122368 RepID=A0A2G5I701_CERBT|nr:hypothetical protein CB0940_01705 [Cercospora beticola]PIB00581.1 hypothetical protein CB0940_01705 [Cercospora beticola]WPA97151.1 hypothetical protein RHO25_001760 [Cercospora beticola]CAK1354446.1 unnamed protein product [Cercospora beticola]
MARFSHRICNIAVASFILYATARAQNGPRTVTVVPMPIPEASSETSSESTTASVAPAASGISCPTDDGRNYTGYAGSYYVECDMEIGGLLLDNDMANKHKRQAMTPETCMAGCQMYGDSCAGVNYRPGYCVYLGSVNTLSPSEGTIALLKAALLAGPPTTYPTASSPATTTSSTVAVSSGVAEQYSSATGDVELPGGYPAGPSVSSAVPTVSTETSTTTSSIEVPNSYATGVAPPSTPISAATSTPTGTSAGPNTSSSGSLVASSLTSNTTPQSTSTSTSTSASGSASPNTSSSGPSTVNVCSNIRTRTTTITTTSTLTTCLPEQTCPTAHYKL